MYGPCGSIARQVESVRDHPAGLIVRFRELDSFRPENATSGTIQVSRIRDYALDLLQDGAVELAGW
jgi:hypothetical protein